MRRAWLIAIVAGCSPPPANHDGSVATVAVEAASGQSAPPEPAGLLPVDVPGLVGMLIENEAQSFTHPSEYCLDDGHLYGGAPARIGDTNVFFDEPVAPLGGKLVLVRGSPGSSLLSALTDRGPCPGDYGDGPTPQMRSDWVSAEGGWSTTKAKLEKLGFFKASAITAVDLGAKMASDGDKVTIELRNPFAASLNGLRARAHYEGGPGKPMPRFEPLTLDLPPGGTQKLVLAGDIEGGPAGQAHGDPRGRYRLLSIDLDGRVGAVDFSVSLIVQAPGVRKR